MQSSTLSLNTGTNLFGGSPRLSFTVSLLNFCTLSSIAGTSILSNTVCDHTSTLSSNSLSPSHMLRLSAISSATSLRFSNSVSCTPKRF